MRLGDRVVMALRKSTQALFACVVLALLLVGCSSSSPRLMPVSGTAMTVGGPVPGTRRGFAASIIVRKQGNSSRYAHTTANADGSWQVKLRSGDYTIDMETGCSPQQVHVSEGHSVTGVSLVCHVP